MPDNLSPENRLKTMKAVKSKRTGLERQLFSMLAGMRLRGWQQNVAQLPGCPDAAFPKDRVAIFVDGCFWHGCPVCHRPLPETNRDYWVSKVAGNMERDQRTTKALGDDGWCVIRIWEHSMRNVAERPAIRAQIRQALADARRTA